MKRKLSSKDAVRLIGELAFGNANDAVKLAFLEPENQELIDKLDLRMVSEIKRGSNGAIEVKLINRIAILELLTQLLNSSGDQSKEAESFFCAMDKAAARLCEAEQ